MNETTPQTVSALRINGERFTRGFCSITAFTKPIPSNQGHELSGPRAHGYIRIQMWHLAQAEYDALEAASRMKTGYFPYCEMGEVPASMVDLDWDAPEVRSALIMAGERVTPVGVFIPDNVVVTANTHGEVKRYTVEIGGTVIGEQQWVTKQK